MGAPKYFIYDKEVSRAQQFDCWKKIFENTFRNDKGAIDLIKCDANEEFIDCAISEKHISLLTKDGKVCRVVYRVHEKKSKHENTPGKNDKNKDRSKRPRLGADTQHQTAAAPATQRQTNDITNPDETIGLRNSITTSTISHQLRRLRGISGNIIPDNLITRIQNEFPETSRDLVAVALAQNNLNFADAMVALSRRTSEPAPNTTTATTTTGDNTPNTTTTTTTGINRRFSADHNYPSTTTGNQTFNDDTARFIVANLRSLYPTTTTSVNPHNLDDSRTVTNSAAAATLSNPLTLPSVRFSTNNLVSRAAQINNYCRESQFSHSANNKLDCQDDMCVEVQSTIWYSMDNDVKIARIFAMKSDLIMLDEFGCLHLWNWRKLKPLTTIRKNSWGSATSAHTHTRLSELGVGNEEKITHIDATSLRCCFATNSNHVYTFLDRCIPFRPELNHKIPMTTIITNDTMDSCIKKINVCDPYVVILMENGQAYFWGLKTMSTTMVCGKNPHLTQLKGGAHKHDNDNADNFSVGCKVYNFRCALHHRGSLVVDFSNDTIRFGRLLNDISVGNKTVTVEVVNDYRDYGSFAVAHKFSKPTKRLRSSAPHITGVAAAATNTITTTTTLDQLRITETWRMESVIFLDDMLDNTHRFEIGVVMKVEKNNLIVSTDAELIDKAAPFSEMISAAATTTTTKNDGSSANVINSLSVWKIGDAHIINEHNIEQVMSYVKYQLPKEPLKINLPTSGNKILAVSVNPSNIITIVERSNGTINGSQFEYDKENHFKEIQFDLPHSISFGLTNANFTITDMKNITDLTILTTSDGGGETIFKRLTPEDIATEYIDSKINLKPRLLDTPAFPVISTLRLFSHHKSSCSTKVNKHFNMCIFLPATTKPARSIFNDTVSMEIEEAAAEKYAPENLIGQSLFYQRQNILHVMAYEALYYGYKQNGINPEKELAIAQHVRQFVQCTPYVQTICNYLVSCDINGFTPIIYAISIRSYHVANVYVEFVLDLLSKLDATNIESNLLLDEDNKDDLKIKLLRAIFPIKSSQPNNSIYYMLCANNVCSFTWSGPKHVKQDIYQCKTCTLLGKLCCCAQCASVCHYGHNCVLMRSSPTAFCDCWGVAHCKALISGDQDMRLHLFKLLVDSVDIFGDSCNERWDILVSFLLYTESRLDFHPKPPSSDLTPPPPTDSTSNFDQQIPPIPTFTRKDPLSSEAVSTTDLERIYQRGLVHGFKISSFVAKFDFIIAALEIIFSSVSLVNRILIQRDLTMDSNSNLGGGGTNPNLVREYSSYQATYNFPTDSVNLEEEIGTSHEQFDVRYVDSTVCYLIFKCKVDPLNRLIRSLKNQHHSSRDDSGGGVDNSIIGVFIRAVCRVFNVFVSGMSPMLFKDKEIVKYLDVFYELFGINPALSVTTLITMANAIITPVIMNVSHCLHNVSLSDNVADCIDKTVKMFILHPKVSRDKQYNSKLFSREDLLGTLSYQNYTASPAASFDGYNIDDSDDDGGGDDSDDDDDDISNDNTTSSTSSSDNDVDANHHSDEDGDNDVDINHHSDEDGDDVDIVGIVDVIDHQHDSSSTINGDDRDSSDISSSYFTNRSYSGLDYSGDHIDGVSERDYSTSSSRDDDDDHYNNGISENSDISHIFDNDDTPRSGGGGGGGIIGSFDVMPRLFNQFGRQIPDTPTLTVRFNNNNNNNNNTNTSSSQLRDVYRNNNTFEAPLDWSIVNSANHIRGRNGGSDTFGPRSQLVTEGHPRIMSTLFNDNQTTTRNGGRRSNGGGGDDGNGNANGGTVSLLAASKSHPTILSSNEASARTFAIIIRTICTIMNRFNMYNNEQFSDVFCAVRSGFDCVTTWLFRIMDYTESMLRQGIATFYRQPSVMRNEMDFLVQNYQQLHDTTNRGWDFFRHCSDFTLGDDARFFSDLNARLRLNFLSGILSLTRSSHNEHLYMMPKVDLSSMRYVAYIFDAFVYYMKEQKFATPTISGDVRGSDGSMEALLDQDNNVVRNKSRFFKRTESTLMLASLVPDELTTSLRDALPVAANPTLLTSTSNKQDLFGFAANNNPMKRESHHHVKIDGLSQQQPSTSSSTAANNNNRPYSNNLFEYNQNKVTGDLFEWDLVELYSRWNCCVTSFAKLFMKDVGVEPGSSLLEIGHYDTKVRSFKRILNRAMYKSFKQYTFQDMPRDFQEILPVTFEKLNIIFRTPKPATHQKIPRIIATFINEPGEGQGVTKNFINDVFLAIMTLKKLPDLTRVLLNTHSYLDFSLMDDEETLVDSCVLRLSGANRLSEFTSHNDPVFDESSSYAATSYTKAQKNVGRCILNFLLRKNVASAALITGTIVALPYNAMMRCVTNHHVLQTYVKSIQVNLNVPLGLRVTKQQLCSNEDVAGAKFEDNEGLFCEGGGTIKGQYIPLPGKRSRERINAFINVGRLIGQCIVLDVPCPMVLVRPVVKYIIGRQISWHDFAFYDGSLYESMRKMIIDALSYENKHEHLYELYFAAEKMVSGKLEIFDLIPDGRNVIVTPMNVLVYVEKFCLFQMVQCVRIELEAMKKGLNQVIPLEMFSTLTAEDFKLVLNGCTFVTADMLRKVTMFVVEVNHPPENGIPQFKAWFWSVFSEFTPKQRSDLLTFWTSSPNLSAEYLSLKSTNPTVVIKYVDDNRLPTANTCSTKLFVPLYTSKKILKTQLLAAIKCKTFGFV